MHLSLRAKDLFPGVRIGETDCCDSLNRRAVTKEATRNGKTLLSRPCGHGTSYNQLSQSSRGMSKMLSHSWAIIIASLPECLPNLSLLAARTSPKVHSHYSPRHCRCLGRDLSRTGRSAGTTLVRKPVSSVLSSVRCSSCWYGDLSSVAAARNLFAICIPCICASWVWHCLRRGHAWLRRASVVSLCRSGRNRRWI